MRRVVRSQRGKTAARKRKSVSDALHRVNEAAPVPLKTAENAGRLFAIPAEAVALLFGGFLEQVQIFPRVQVAASRENSVQHAHRSGIGSSKRRRLDGRHKTLVREARDG